jgi:light-regulated signal transduction histidine kinase (bacteriophytochrome)
MDKIKAELQLLHVKTKANARSIRNQSAVVESVQRQSEQVRADVVSELLSVTKGLAQAEEQLRAKMQAQAHDVRQQLSALHEMMQNLQGQEDKSQERRDLDQDKKIEKLSAGLSSAHELIAGLNAERQQLASVSQKSSISGFTC